MVSVCQPAATKSGARTTSRHRVAVDFARLWVGERAPIDGTKRSLELVVALGNVEGTAKRGPGGQCQSAAGAAAAAPY